jgi:hypothetical protein
VAFVAAKRARATCGVALQLGYDLARVLVGQPETAKDMRHEKNAVTTKTIWSQAFYELDIMRPQSRCKLASTESLSCTVHSSINVVSGNPAMVECY